MASAKQLEQRQQNIRAIITFIRKHTAVTRMEISRALSLSWACVSELVALLLAEEVLTETDQGPQRTEAAARGRTPTVLTLNRKKYFLGVDINDSGIAITTISMNGEKTGSQKWEPECFQNEKQLVSSVCAKISEKLRDADDCCGIGIAMEGMRTHDGGYLYPFAKGYTAVYPEEFIANHFGLPAFSRHDPECVLYSIAHSIDEDCIAIRVDNGIGVAAMKHGEILELPLELGFVRCGSLRLKDILRSCGKTGDYSPVAEALGYSAGNLALMLDAKKCFLAGDIITWFDGVSASFDAAFKSVSHTLEYKVCLVPDASDGAARVAMAAYSVAMHNRKEGNRHE